MTDIRPRHLPPLGPDALVSVVVTSYNYAQFIRDALDSILRQRYSHLEIIVADDGSEDETPEIVLEYQGIDSRVRLLRGQNLGQPANTNRGFAAARGEIVCFLDADDKFKDGKIEAIVAAFRNFPDCGLCVHPLQRIDGQGRAFRSSFPESIDSGWLPALLLANGGRCSFPPTSALSIRREIGSLIFPIASASKRNGDAYIHYPAAFLTRVHALPSIYGEYRCHRGSMTCRSTSKADQLRALLRDYEEVFATTRLFVARQFGDSVAGKLRLTDSQGYLVLGLYHLLLSGGFDYNGLSAPNLVELLRDRRQKAIWTLLANLPPPISRGALVLRGNLLESIRRGLAWLSGWRRRLLCQSARMRGGMDVQYGVEGKSGCQRF